MAQYDNNVFINCPFDDDYLPLFEAILFTVMECGYTPRCAKELSDSGSTRIEKIFTLVAECRLGIHDLSRTELDAEHGLPRFNMPLELGIFLGAKHFGNSNQRRKTCIVLDRDRFRYQKFCSDIAGQDPKSHEGEIAGAIRAVRNWLQSAGGLIRSTATPGAHAIESRYGSFRLDLPRLCDKMYLAPGDLTYVDVRDLIAIWQEEFPPLSL